MIQTNEESDSSSSTEEDEELALQNSLIFQYQLQFGEGTFIVFSIYPLQTNYLIVWKMKMV